MKKQHVTPKNKDEFKVPVWLVAIYTVIYYVLLTMTAVALSSMILQSTVEASEVKHQRICVAADREPLVIDGVDYYPAMPECKETNVIVKIKKVFLYIGKIGITIAAILRGPAIVDSVTAMWEYTPYE